MTQLTYSSENEPYIVKLHSGPTLEPTANPTSSPTDETSYYIVAGKYSSGGWDDYAEAEYVLCTKENSNQASIEAPTDVFDGNNIAVSCCSNNGSIGYRPSCNAYNKTYDEAKTICEDNGYRLCTLQEMLWDKVTGSAGCGFDGAYNWVSTKCS